MCAEWKRSCIGSSLAAVVAAGPAAAVQVLIVLPSPPRCVHRYVYVVDRGGGAKFAW